MSLRIGIDTGGTFTDFVRLDGRRLTVHKVRSTPADPAEAILDGLREVAGGASDPEVVHGSTIATNAVLERAGARVALVATRGFEDVLRIGRQTRSELYNHFAPLPRPLVDPAMTFGVSERMDAAGRTIEPVNDAEVERLAERIRESGADIVAVCLLHAYMNPGHEARVADVLRRRGLTVRTSHEILPEYREFERWSTTAVSAYVTPIVDRYLGRLEPAVRNLSIMQSNGGSISAGAARAQAVRTILSGPAAGVVGAQAVAAAAGFPRVIGFDMGGTSTDVSLIDGDIPTTTDSRVGDFPVRLPIIDIETVGAGGGSIAAVDTGGALRVGPRSAGADPGPVCYGKGEELTVTDANLLLGRLSPDRFFAGRIAVDAARAREAAKAMAATLGIPVHALAEGIVRVANANMERAIRVVSLERGHDPRMFALLAFGGAGGMHACEIAERLEMATVIVPRYAGVLSALGMLTADVTRDYSAPVLRPMDAITARSLESMFAPIVTRARAELAAEGFAPRRQAIARRIDIRYVGQSYELTLPFDRDVRSAFDRLHQKRYGYSDPARPTEVVNIRVVASGLTDKPALPFERVRRTCAAKPAAIRSGRFNGKQARVAHYDWDALRPGARAGGPAVITSGEATVVIPPSFRFNIDGFRNVISRRRQSG
jgi:N-methylhydantoinase A/oxoprolinase/acetone carboxylase beta subunit